MKKLDTYRIFDEEGYQVMSFDDESGLKLLDEGKPLPIRMKITLCQLHQDESNESVDIASIAEVDFSPRADKDFYCHFVEILHGQYDGWILKKFQLRCCGVALTYYCPTTKESQEVVLNGYKNGLHIVRLNFSVPHANSKPDTEYDLRIHCGESFSIICISEKTQDSYTLDIFDNDIDDGYPSIDYVPKEAVEIIYTDF